MKKSDITVLPDFYGRYINEVDDIELSDALDKYGVNLLIKDKDKLNSLGDKVYSTGKWTVKEIIQHIIDAERVFSYRAVRLARNDKTELPGFEENEYAPASKANRRSIDDLLNELEIIRKSTIVLFNSFDEEMLKREGICSGNKISVLGIGFVIAAHFFHHTKVIQDRYLVLQ